MTVASLADIIRYIRNRSLRGRSTGAYRPEKHYMRGRGPAWTGKNQIMESDAGAREPETKKTEPGKGGS